jgi:para-nitrobenzyl esterase
MSPLATLRSTFVAAVAALTIVGLPVAPAARAAPGGGLDRDLLPAAGQTVVRVDSGAIRGKAGADTIRFSGIPYAAPPVGDRRWTAPRPPRPWTGVRDATSPAPVCLQIGRDEQFNEIVVGAEDCLHVDVVAPARPSRLGRLPVIVWLHGGNFASGAGSQYDGARLAASGEVIVVTVNYRLGALGFLSSAKLDAEGTISGGYGLLDQAEALRWVRRNAAAFGGDPRQVTLAGQSAGARAVCTHLAAPTSRGLFQRAIVQSGACANPVMTKADAERKGTQAIEQVGCAGATNVTSCLRQAPMTKLVRALAGPNRPVTAERRDDPWGPVAGTRWLPRQPIDAIRQGSAAGVPLLIGSTHDEMTGFVLSQHHDLTAEDYAAKIRATFTDRAEDVLGQYPVDDFAAPALALSTVLTDWGGGIGSCPTLATARTASRHAPVYTYELLDGPPPFGAYHGWDLPFLWKTSIPMSQYPDYEDMTPDQQRLSRTMIDYWTTFAHRGDPNTTGQPRWARTHPESASALGLAGDKVAPTPFATDHKCGFWDRA